MKKRLLAAVIAVFALLLLLRPEAAEEAVRGGLALCFQTVVPSLFPFFVVVSLLLQLGLGRWLGRLFSPFMEPLFHLSGAAVTPLIAGLIGGYPSGARTAAELYREGTLTREEAERCLAFVNNCGPAFALSFVGTAVLRSERAGLALYLIHVLSALLTGLLLCRRGCRGRSPTPPVRRPLPKKSFTEMFTGAVTSSFSATLNICAFVALFRAAAGVLPAHFPPAVLGFFEMVTGTASLQPGQAGFVAAAAILSWGGLSVHCQTLSVIGDLSARRHWLGKSVQTALSAGIALAVWPWI